MRSFRNATSAILLSSAYVLAASVIAAPIDLDLTQKVAYADRGGGGHGGGGHGGGNGHGGGQGHGGSHGTGHGHSVGHGSMASHTVSGATIVDDDSTGADDLGRLNAAHASPNALAHAAPNSTVGRIASYLDSVLAGDTESAAGAVSGAANKSVTDRALHALNELLGIDETVIDPDEGTTVHDTEGDVSALANDT